MREKEIQLLEIIRGSRGFFVLAFVSVILAVIANYLTPQVIRITVDSVLDDKPFSLPGFLLSWVESLGGRDALRQNLLLCAAFALFFSLLSGLFNYLSRMGIATLPQIRRALPGYPTQTVEKAVRELRQENVVAVVVKGNNRVQKRPLRLEVVE